MRRDVKVRSPMVSGVRLMSSPLWERLDNGVCWLVRLVGAGRYGAPGLGNKNREYLFFFAGGYLSGSGRRISRPERR